MALGDPAQEAPIRPVGLLVVPLLHHMAPTLHSRSECGSQAEVADWRQRMATCSWHMAAGGPWTQAIESNEEVALLRSFAVFSSQL